MNKGDLAKLALRERRAGRNPSRVLAAAVQGIGPAEFDAGKFSGVGVPPLNADVGERIKDILLDSSFGDSLFAGFRAAGPSDETQQLKIDMISEDIISLFSPVAQGLASGGGITSAEVDKYISDVIGPMVQLYVNGLISFEY